MTQVQAVDWDTGITNGVSDFFTSLGAFIPRLIAFLAILLIGYFIAKALATVVDKVLERVGFDQAVERGGIKQALAKSKYDASDLVSKLVFYTLFLIVLSAAFNALQIAAITNLLQRVVNFLPNLFVAIAIIVIAAAIAKAVKDLVTNALGGLPYGKALGTAASVFILLFGVKAALDQVGVATTVTGPVLNAILLTIAGVTIVGVGGGLIRPMQARWEEWLNKASQESQNVKAQMQYNKQQQQMQQGQPMQGQPMQGQPMQGQPAYGQPAGYVDLNAPTEAYTTPGGSRRV